MRHLLIAAFGMLLLTCLDSLIKALSATFPTFQIVLLRFAFGTLWAGSIVLVRAHPLPGRQRMKAHFVRACLMILTASSFFYALGKIPLAELFALTFTAPIFTALFGALFLKEPIPPRIALALVAGFAGMLAMTIDPAKGGFSLAYDPFGLFCALIAPVTYALSLVLLRSQATAGEPMSIIIAVQSALVAVMISPLALPVFVTPTLSDLGLFAIAGLLGTLGYFAFTIALRHLTAARFSVVEYTGLIWAALIGYFVFAEVPKTSLWFGAPLIIAGCLLALPKEGRTKG